MSVFGIGQQKPHHYREMARIAWENRDQLPFAWRILNDGVCDGCALGTSGLSDWTLPGRAPLHGAPRADAAQHGAGARPGAACPTCRVAAHAHVAASCASSAACRSRCCGVTASRDFSSATWDEALDRIAAGTAHASIRSARPSISPRAASPTRSTTRRRRRRAFWAVRTSTTPRGCATRRRPSAMKSDARLRRRRPAATSTGCTPISSCCSDRTSPTTSRWR